MKTVIITEADRIQLCLQPESEHDKSVLDVLEKLPNTYRTSLYKRQGGYTAFDLPYSTTTGKHDGKDLLIVFEPELVNKEPDYTTEPSN